MSAHHPAQALRSGGMPLILTGVPLGRCATGPPLWTPEYLAAAGGQTDCVLHVSACPQIDLAGHRPPGTARNFVFETMPFAAAVARCAAGSPGGEALYIRSVGAGRSASRLGDLFPCLAADCGGAEALFGSADTHSSVLRIASPGCALWTHYDVMDNCLCQVTGSKRVALWPPRQAANLYCVASSSRVDCPDGPPEALAADWPRALLAHQERVDAELQPGDVLFIPALWFHHVLGRGFSAAVNVFGRGLPAGAYDGKDVYGNRDLPAGGRCVAAAAAAAAHVAALPQPYRSFYAARGAEALQAEAEGAPDQSS